MRLSLLQPSVLYALIGLHPAEGLPYDEDELFEVELIDGRSGKYVCDPSLRDNGRHCAHCLARERG